MSTEDVELLIRLANQASVALVNARLHESIQALSLTDPLTDLPNRHLLLEHLQTALALVLVFWKDYAQLVDYVVFADWIFFGLAGLSLARR